MPFADTDAIYFLSDRPDGSQHHLVGSYYLANTDSPAPFALLLHGIPGSEKNHDLAQSLRADGWHVLVLHLSGTWGSEGNYVIAEHSHDAISAIDYALSDRAPRPINPDKIAVLGFSMGSRAALIAGMLDERIRAVVSISGFADFSEVLIEEDFFQNMPVFLSGTTVDTLSEQFRDLGERVQPTDAIAKIAPRPVLVVHGTDDEIVPYYNAPALNGDHVQHVAIEGARHTFGDYRAELIQSVSKFLGENLA